MIDKVYKVPLYIASRDKLCNDIFVYPQTGQIIQEEDNYSREFREYIRDNKLYIIINGIMYNKAKLIFDSVYKDSLPQKRYKVVVTNGNIARPTIHNIMSTDLGVKDTVFGINDENINIIIDGIDTEINLEYLIEKLSNKEYEVHILEEKD